MTKTQEHKSEIILILREEFQLDYNTQVYFPDRRCNRIVVGRIELHSMVRSPKFFPQRHEVSFRNRHRSPGSLIYQRILAGYARYYFYGIQNPENPSTLGFWRIVDLDVLRNHRREYLSEIHFNTDQHSGFVTILVDSLPPEFSFACSETSPGTLIA